jgi:hypothetical protein
MYANACNGLFYSDDIANDDSLSAETRCNLRVIRDRFKWIKTAIELKAGSGIKAVDTLRYDELFRLMSELDAEHEDVIENMIRDYLKTINK